MAIEVEGFYSSKFTGDQIEEILRFMTTNWEIIRKIPDFESKLKTHSEQITTLFDDKVASLEAILKHIVSNNNGKYVLNPDGISMGTNQIIFNQTGGSVADALTTAGIRFDNSKNYAPVYAFKLGTDVFSMGVHCGKEAEMAWYYNNEKLAYLTQDGCLMGACWNDFAEFRKSDEVEPGRVICENGDGTMSRSYKRLQPGAMIISDTFGFAIGRNEGNAPVAVAGRVLAHTYEDWWCFEPGQPVCAGPNGTVSMMSRREARKYPDRIIGTVSELPTYERWGKHNVEVNGRIWIKVK